MVGDVMQGDVGVVATASEVAKNLTVVTALVIALMGGAFEWYVWGRTHRRRVAEYEQQIGDLRSEHQRQISEKDTEIRKREAEIEWWQRLTLRATEVADWATRGYADGGIPPSPPGRGLRDSSTGPGGR